MQPNQTPSGGRNNKSISTEGGAYVEGAVNTGGHFVGRDWVQKIFIGEREDVIHFRNRQTMLQLVKSTWIQGVLERSLHNAVLIDLNMETRTGAVEYPWDMIIRTPDQIDRPFLQGTKITNVFNEMNQSLLILGAPGSGKTTMILELARQLISYAEQDPTLPIPVVFNLSSWAEKRKPFVDWLVDEFNAKYRIPKKVSQLWIENDELLLLLDGLDEVPQAHTEACVNAINVFRQNHLVPLAICSRTVEYKALNAKLKLEGAIVLLPLNEQQIDNYLDSVGGKLHAVHIMLEQDATLQEFVQSPLILNIMTLAYQDIAIEKLQVLGSIDARRGHLFNAYIDKMFARSARTVTKPYSMKQTIRLLQWLAARLIQHEQTVFLIEQIQPNWAHSAKYSYFIIATAMLMWGPIYGISVGLSVALGFGWTIGFGAWGPRYESRYGLLGGMFFGLYDGLHYGLSFALRYGLFIGVIIGLLDGLSGRFREIKLTAQVGRFWRRIRSSLYSAILWGLITGLFWGLLHGLRYGLFYGLLFGAVGGTIGGFREVKLVTPLRFSREKLRSILISTLIPTLLFALSFGLFPLSYALFLGLFVGLGYGLFFESTSDICITNAQATQAPNQGIKLSARHSLGVAWLLGCIFSLFIGLHDNLVMELRDELRDVLLVGGIIMLNYGLVLVTFIGGDVVTKHCILRLILWWQGHIPWNYARFLDYCHDRIFLRKVGGGYIFIHRMLMEHFANMTDEDIQRIAREVEVRK